MRYYHSSKSLVSDSERGFTLIELSIVLVVIGLIVGGVLVGRDLIKAAEVRAQVTQLEKFNSAVATFQGKYGALPGDICNPQVTQFGFVARAGGIGRGNCDGLLEGFTYSTSYYYGWDQAGETLFFWEDLSKANLIDGSFNAATDAALPTIVATSTPSFGAYLPQAKIGNGNFLYVWSTGSNANGAPVGNDINYLGISVPISINTTGNFTSSLGLTVAQTYAIDAKIDDALPQSGRVQAFYVTGGTPPTYATNAASPSSTTCYDTTSSTYSITQNNSAGMNCALSFRLQAGD